MTDPESLRAALNAAGLSAWSDIAAGWAAERLSRSGHGDFPRWQAALDQLPPLSDRVLHLDRDAVDIAGTIDEAALRDALMQLKPWRKGPFRIAGVDIDTEWRCDLKWRRLEQAVSPLKGRRVLDVGCGNGYYAMRMIGAGAGPVIGIDPTLLFSMQFAAINRYAGLDNLHILPGRDDQLPDPGRCFDTAFSMGVLYHQRAPVDHLLRLKRWLRSEGELVLETIVLPGDEPFSRTPQNRYARMRNVWHLPSVPELLVWLERAGFRDARLIDVTITTTDEQRSTEWMDFESLAESLDPGDPSLTVEGWPAPHRAMLVATAP